MLKKVILCNVLVMCFIGRASENQFNVYSIQARRVIQETLKIRKKLPLEPIQSFCNGRIFDKNNKQKTNQAILSSNFFLIYKAHLLSNGSITRFCYEFAHASEILLTQRIKSFIFLEKLRHDLKFLEAMPNILGQDVIQQIHIEEADKLAQAILNLPEIKSSNATS